MEPGGGSTKEGEGEGGVYRGKKSTSASVSFVAFYIRAVTTPGFPVTMLS